MTGPARRTRRHRKRRGGPLRRHERIALAQGTYYAATGLWPLLHMRSFEAVTGPKTDRWLVHMVGALAFGVGAGLMVAAARRRVTPELRLLSRLCAAGFVAVEVPHVARGRISPVYLLDAVVEAGLLAADATAEPTPARPGPDDVRRGPADRTAAPAAVSAGGSGPPRR